MMNNVESLNVSSSRMKLITTIKRYDHGNDYVRSICLLRDGRLVSGGKYGIVIHNKHTHQSDIIIKEDDSVLSVCGLRNGNLTAGNNDGYIFIYEIDGNEYKLIHTLKQHSNSVYKVIELEDGRLSSCSWDKTIRIWDENYQPIQTLTEHTHWVAGVIEMNDYIISSTSKYDDDGVRIWNKHTYECIKTIPHLYSCGRNGLSKLGENRIILGGWNKLFVLDILSFQSKSFQDQTLGYIESILVLREDEILLGNDKGEIVCYDSLSNQIIFTQSIFDKDDIVWCIIESEDKKILSSSHDGNINVYG